MEPTIYKPSIYKGTGGIYKGRGVYNDGAGGGGNTVEIGGRTYHIVDMPDGKTWLVENLQLTWSGLVISSSVQGVPAACYYNNDPSTYGLDGPRKCGLLYNGHSVRYLEANKASLIPGWHVPTIDEWRNLKSSIGGGNDAGKKLKADNVDWAPNWNGLNEYGFSVLPAGYWYYNSFYQIAESSYIWASTQYNANANWCVVFHDYDASLGEYQGRVEFHAHSIRLVKD